MYGCEAWSVALTKEKWQKVFENSVLKKIFGPKREDVSGD
jgi:hypothetical protein